jgi:D-alanyl-D-alanine carboxypeptidase/D-alanyl-D-alanine-endopeptidase (penicillin-binding protein 4)
VRPRYAHRFKATSALPALFACLVLAAAAVAQPLDEAVRTLVARTGLSNARVGVLAIDLSSGETIANYNADASLIPASNQKLLTSGAALHALGPDFVFETRLLRDGDRLWVVGDGDPGFADSELLKEMGIGFDEFMQVWVDAVKRSGGGPIREVIVDARIFDTERVHESWPQDQLNRWYCAEVSGLNFHANVISVFAEPTSPGAAPNLMTEPRADWLVVRNRGETVNRGTNTLWVSRGLSSNEMTLRGNVRWATEEPVLVALYEPGDIFAKLLADALERAGLGSPTGRLAGDADPAATGDTVAVVRTPISTALRRCNVDSYNLYADALLKRAGYKVTSQQGSWGSGAAVVRMAIGDRLGPQRAASVSVADGSGMSRENRVTATTLVEWMGSIVDDDRIGGPFYESLPLAGEDGTLSRRFQGAHLEHEVRAKSGYLNVVSNLSGFVTDRSSGRRIAFAILVNDFPTSLPVRAVKSFHEDVVGLLDEWLWK